MLSVTYSKPPLVETSMGLHFAPISGWNVNLFGSYQEVIKTRYPKFETAAPLVFTQSPSPTFLSFSTSNAPKIRAFYTDMVRTRLLQVQDDIFFANWQKMLDGERYPRYPQLVSQFLEEWDGYRAFLETKSLTIGAVSRHQLSYVNVFERGGPNPELGIEDIFVNWMPSVQPVGSQLRDVSLTAIYSLDGIELSFQLQPAVRLTDGKPVFQFTLTTTRSQVDVNGSDLRSGFDSLHRVLIEAFEEFTSQNAKDVWGRQS